MKNRQKIDTGTWHITQTEVHGNRKKTADLSGLINSIHTLYIKTFATECFISIGGSCACGIAKEIDIPLYS